MSFLLNDIKGLKEQIKILKNQPIDLLIIDYQMFSDQVIIINDYNFTIENVKLVNTIYLLFFEAHFKSTGCPDLVLKLIWIIVCITKKVFKKDEKQKTYDNMLIDLIFSKLNSFFNLEIYTNFLNNYYNNKYRYFQRKEISFSRTSDSLQSSLQFGFPCMYKKEKEFLDYLFSRIFKLNSILDMELNDNYLDPLINFTNSDKNDIPNNQPENNLIESLFNSLDNIKHNKNIDLPLNEEENLKVDSFLNQSDGILQRQVNSKNQEKFDHSNNNPNDIIKRNSKNIFPDINMANNKDYFGIGGSNLKSNLWNIENAGFFLKNIDDKQLSSNLTSKEIEAYNLTSNFQIIHYDFARILKILTKFYNKYFECENELDDLIVYENINLEKFLESSKEITSKSNIDSNKDNTEKIQNNTGIKIHQQSSKIQETNSGEFNNYNQFIKSLDNYNYTETHYFIKKYNLKFDLQYNKIEDFNYFTIYENFYQNFLKKNEYLSQQSNRIKSSYDKNIFFKLLDDFISQIFIKTAQNKEIQNLKDKINKNTKNGGNSKKLQKYSFTEYYNIFGFDGDFFQNLFIIAYFLYLSLLLVGKPNSDDCIYSYIKTISLYKNINFPLIFYQIDNINKLNYSSSIKRIIKNFNNLIVSLVLINKNSYFYKHTKKLQSKKSKNLKKEEKLQLHQKQDFDSVEYQDFKEKQIKMILKRIYTYAASNFDTCFKRWKIKENHYEKIWILFKFIISDFTDILLDHSLDFIIILSVFIYNQSIDSKSQFFAFETLGNLNIYKTVGKEAAINNSNSLFNNIILDYIESNKNDYSNILKKILIPSNTQEYFTTENKTSLFADDTKIKTENDKKDLDTKLPIKLLNDLEFYAARIFHDKEHVLKTFIPTNEFLYDASEFEKYKNFSAYEMNTIYNYSPNIKIISNGNKKSNLNVKLFSSTNLQKTTANAANVNFDQLKGLLTKETSQTNNTSEDCKSNLIKNNNKINNYIPIQVSSIFSSNKFFNETIEKNNNDSITFLKSKIQKITTPISSKMINSSPFKEKTNLLGKKYNSSFRNLQKEFE